MTYHYLFNSRGQKNRELKLPDRGQRPSSLTVNLFNDSYISHPVAQLSLQQSTIRYPLRFILEVIKCYFHRNCQTFEFACENGFPWLDSMYNTIHAPIHLLPRCWRIPFSKCPQTVFNKVFHYSSVHFKISKQF